ncbi:hypothetical protein LZ012_06140 [Dechloromonas sp. XY25]|uniref:Hemerythrin-like domain-containing protein n=1 Tax=Dechloromonas hankyongensis TaxID=2908002 RepID=A0ABS9K078_9RHOO|nr:hypothetical protein [Dechloromonas hankyongensis]MCG2576574.1 hypothetical protein [Dechloromonas hankyongensis]
MPSIREQAIETMRRDHEHLLQLIDRIQSMCDQRDRLDNCNDCHASQRGICSGNIEQTIRAFVETTLKHNVIELMFMEGIVPAAHRIAHNQAHMAIAEQLKEIRVVFAKDGNGIHAIEGIERVRETLFAHFQEHDRQLEDYLGAAVAGA